VGGTRCWVELLGGAAGWSCWVELLGGAAGWSCWVELLGGAAGWSWVELLGRAGWTSVHTTPFMHYSHLSRLTPHHPYLNFCALPSPPSSPHAAAPCVRPL